MTRLQLWTIDEQDGHPRAVTVDAADATRTEEFLEDLLVRSPNLLLEGLTLIGRQVPTEGGPLDLIGVDRDGSIVVFELKRGTLTRDAVAQVIDYASDLASKDPEQFARLIEERSGSMGIGSIENFQDFYAREFPSAPDLLSEVPRMVLVGLGADDRAKRMVAFLSSAGIDIQLLTFHAFRSEGRLMLAREDDGPAPTAKGTRTGGSTKEQNQKVLREAAEQHGSWDLLSEVAGFVEQHMPAYRWPGKSAYSFSLAETTEEGKPSQRSYVTVWIHPKRRGAVLVTLPPRAVDVAGGEVEAFLSTVPGAERTESKWTPIEVTIDASGWPKVQPALSALLKGIVDAWRARTAEGAGDTP